MYNLKFNEGLVKNEQVLNKLRKKDFEGMLNETMNSLCKDNFKGLKECVLSFSDNVKDILTCENSLYFVFKLYMYELIHFWSHATSGSELDMEGSEFWSCVQDALLYDGEFMSTLKCVHDDFIKSIE